MRVIIGGAYNGKKEFVKKSLSHIDQNVIHFFDGEIPTTSFTKDDYVVISNFEEMILNMSEFEEDEIAKHLIEAILKLDSQTNVYCICNDIGRGVVPIEKEQRKLRDTCGRLYQKLFEESKSIVRIWYGIPQIIKECHDHE